MLKLNNKGMTSVEILVCFVLVVIIATSMYTTVVAYKNKQQIESYKQRVLTYKNLLTKEIQDDLIKKGLISATTNRCYKNTISECDDNSDQKTGITKVNLIFADGTNKTLEINTSSDNNFGVKYGENSYPLPDFGSHCKDSSGNEIDFDEYGNCSGTKIRNLRIQNVDVNTDDNILTIKFDFYHPDLSVRYGVSIVCPINYS